jgi:hypothetical protein
MKQDGGKTNGLVRAQETWLDEGLASAAEYVYNSGQITAKIDYFNADQGRVFARGNTFFVWDGAYSDYCSVYLFFQWLRIQSLDDIAIYRDIINSPHRNFQAVTEAAAEHIDPRFADWETLLKTWLLANHVSSKEGFLGYKNEFLTQIAAITGTSAWLAPGGGVFSFLDGNGFAEPADQSKSHIRYISVTKEGILVNTAEDPLYKTGYRLLTFNANESNQAGAETGKLSGKWEPSLRPPVIMPPRQAGTPSGPYPIDIPPSWWDIQD